MHLPSQQIVYVVFVIPAMAVQFRSESSSPTYIIVAEAIRAWRGICIYSVYYFSNHNPKNPQSKTVGTK